jgi:hypothetical protein
VPALPELQAALGRALLAGDGDPLDAALAGALADGAVPAAAGLAVYRHHVRASLAAVLEAAFPAVCRIVDARFFRWAADGYVRAHPPAGPCLHEYGAGFPAFLAGFAPCGDLPYLPDVARLEWALHAAVHAEDAPPVDPARLRAHAPGDLARAVLRLHPSLSLVASPWPVDRIWRANQPGADRGETVDLRGGAVALEVRRDGDDAVFRALDPADHALRRALAAGAPLERAAAAALGIDPGFDLAGALRDLLAGGLVTGFTLTPDVPEDAP